MDEMERDLGPQPLAALLEQHGVSHHDVVAASPAQMTHKMVARACKGRRLTRRVQLKLRDAVNAATGENYTLKDLFMY